MPISAVCTCVIHVLCYHPFHRKISAKYRFLFSNIVFSQKYKVKVLIFLRLNELKKYIDILWQLGKKWVKYII